jgi:hypothetical protein
VERTNLIVRTFLATDESDAGHRKDDTRGMNGQPVQPALVLDDKPDWHQNSSSGRAPWDV